MVSNTPLGAIKAEGPQCLVQRLDWLSDQVDDRFATFIYLCSILVHQQIGVAELRQRRGGNAYPTTINKRAPA